jgi:hypothetical protein
MALNITTGHKIYQHFIFQGTPKCTQIDIFGLKIGMPSGNPALNFI